VWNPKGIPHLFITNARKGEERVVLTPSIRALNRAIASHPNGVTRRICCHRQQGLTIMQHFAPLLLLLIATPAIAGPALVDVSAARASLAGNWEGSLEYLDYGANKWFGIPVKTVVEDQGDGVTMIRKSDFDDGPKVGNVRITSVELFDPAAGTVTTGTFRKGRRVEVSTYTVRLEGTATDMTRWTMVEESPGKDDDRPAMLRLTTICDGDKVETVKQVDFQDDDKSEWLTRNRTRLTRVTAR
jgi:hypothetical protein